MTSFGPSQYNFYQKSAAEYRQRQESLRSQGKYVMTIKNHRQFMRNQKTQKSAKEHIAQFLDIDLSQHPDVLQDTRAHLNEKNPRDFTVIFLFTLTDKELAQRVMKQRSEKFKQIGSFNVQLAQEDKLSVNRKLKPLKSAGIITGYGQNQLGIMYIALKKLPEEIDDVTVFPSGTCSDKRFILLNAPALDCELKDAESFRRLARPVDSVYVAKNSVSGKFLVLNKPENTVMMDKGGIPRCTSFSGLNVSNVGVWNNSVSDVWKNGGLHKNSGSFGVSKNITCEISNFDEFPRHRSQPRGRLHTAGDFRGALREKVNKPEMMNNTSDQIRSDQLRNGHGNRQHQVHSSQTQHSVRPTGDGRGFYNDDPGFGESSTKYVIDRTGLPQPRPPSFVMSSAVTDGYVTNTYLIQERNYSGQPPQNQNFSSQNSSGISSQNHFQTANHGIYKYHNMGYSEEQLPNYLNQEQHHSNWNQQVFPDNQQNIAEFQNSADYQNYGSSFIHSDQPQQKGYPSKKLYSSPITERKRFEKSTAPPPGFVPMNAAPSYHQPQNGSEKRAPDDVVRGSCGTECSPLSSGHSKSEEELTNQVHLQKIFSKQENLDNMFHGFKADSIFGFEIQDEDTKHHKQYQNQNLFGETVSKKNETSQHLFRDRNEVDQNLSSVFSQVQINDQREAPNVFSQRSLSNQNFAPGPKPHSINRHATWAEPSGQ